MKDWSFGTLNGSAAITISCFSYGNDDDVACKELITGLCYDVRKHIQRDIFLYLFLFREKKRVQNHLDSVPR